MAIEFKMNGVTGFLVFGLNDVDDIGEGDGGLLLFTGDEGIDTVNVFSVGTLLKYFPLFEDE
jgi:hypothetical protein